MLDVAAVASDTGVFSRVLSGDVINHQGAIWHDLNPANHTEPCASTRGQKQAWGTCSPMSSGCLSPMPHCNQLESQAVQCSRKKWLQLNCSLAEWVTLGPGESRLWDTVTNDCMSPPNWDPKTTPLAPACWVSMQSTMLHHTAVWNGGCVPGQELARIQNLVLPFPLDVRHGVPLCLALEHGCVSLVHCCGLWL